MGDRVLNPLLTSGELPLSITKLLSAMTKETVFQPSHLFHDGTEGHQRFFYIDEMKVFLLFQVKQARIVKLDLVQRSVNDTDKVAAVYELLVNFTLHYLWTLM